MVTKILGESRCLRADTGRRRAMRAGLDKIRVTQMYERMEGSGITTNHIKIGMNGHKVTRTLIWLQIGSESHSSSLCTQLISPESIRCNIEHRVESLWELNRSQTRNNNLVSKWKTGKMKLSFLYICHLGSRDIDRGPGLLTLTTSGLM